MFHWICTLVEYHQGLWTMNLFPPGIVTATSQSAHQLTLPAEIHWANKTKHIMYNSSCQLAVQVTWEHPHEAHKWNTEMLPHMVMHEIGC